MKDFEVKNKEQSYYLILVLIVLQVISLLLHPEWNYKVIVLTSALFIIYALFSKKIYSIKVTSKDVEITYRFFCLKRIKKISLGNCKMEQSKEISFRAKSLIKYNIFDADKLVFQIDNLSGFSNEDLSFLLKEISNKKI